ncbi:hypothetical protein CKO28_01380 [Rhodovibrio sodomensis]|uniref:AAA+ ATPase domain-containing protein n=2 Tax=Rhodovibrio sodomensis TaxID=1088 RepID=A0ABS1D9X1_9PROT|nr:hypothetical protein [Rhodovibrio sodomensis]
MKTVRVDFGQTKFANKKTNQKDRVVLDTTKTINGHILIAGASGTGKTHQLRRVIDAMSKQPPHPRFHIIDVHGDLDIPGASSCKFSESSPYGVNPLKVDPDPHSGGVRKRARSFIASLNRTTSKLGTKQESALYHLLTDLYEANGFYLDKPESWDVKTDLRRNPRHPKKQPTLGDLKTFAEWRLAQMTTGAGSKALSKLDELNRKVRQLHRKSDKGDDSEQKQVEKLRAEAADLYREYVMAVETGRELPQYLTYAGRDVMQSVFERISNLESSGIFRPRKPDFDLNAPVRRYDISALSRDEQILFIDFLASEMFQAARRKGQAAHPRDFIVIDESHAFVSAEPDHILNVIIRESRKFGIGLILASQSLSDFPDDIIANTSTKVILGLDEMFHASTARKLAIDPKRFGWVYPRRTALIQIKRAGDTSNRYLDVELC